MPGTSPHCAAGYLATSLCFLLLLPTGQASGQSGLNLDKKQEGVGATERHRTIKQSQAKKSQNYLFKQK